MPVKKVVTDNPCRPHGFGRLDPATTVPFQKNPVIGAFFRQIDRADELGSGMRKMMLYGKKYGGADPELIEGNIFRMVISVPEFGANPAEVPQIISATHPSEQVTGEVLKLICAMTGELKRTEIQKKLGLKHEDHFREAYLLPSLNTGLIEMTIPGKPKSSKQKYRLTDKGRMLLEKNS
ncbi:MAG: Fic family protein [Desulfatirhabdiaceae bacterium]